MHAGLKKPLFKFQSLHILLKLFCVHLPINLCVCKFSVTRQEQPKGIIAIDNSLT